MSAIVTAHHAFTSAERYELKNDARNHNGSEESGVEYQAKLKQALDAAWAGRFSVLIGSGRDSGPGGHENGRRRQRRDDMFD